MKPCKTCNREQPLSDYYVKSECKDGHSSECKSCTKKRPRLRYHAAPQEMITRVLTSMSKKPVKYKEYSKNYAKHDSSPRLSSKGKRFFCGFVIRPIILFRDNYRCQLCQNHKNLKLHHILPVRYDTNDANILNPRNLIILCHECHWKRAHKGHFKLLDHTLALRLLNLVREKETDFPTILPEYLEETSSVVQEH